MGVLQRFERRLEGLVSGAFTRVFKGQVEPVEVAAQLQRETDDHRTIVGEGRILVPNDFVVELGASDYERLSPYARPLGEELADMVGEHAVEHGYSFVGPVRVRLEYVDDLDTGRFSIRSGVAGAGDRAAGAGPAGAPHPAASPASTPRAAPPASPRRAAPPTASRPAAPVPAAPAPPAPWQAAPGAAAQRPVGAAPRPAAPSPAGPPVKAWSRPGPDGDSYPTPVLPAMPTLVITSGTGEPRALSLTSQLATLGRGTDCDLRLDDTGVSRRHAEVRLDAGGATVTDLGSTNGTTVNGERIRSRRLTDGDELVLGSTTLTFRQGGR